MLEEWGAPGVIKGGVLMDSQVIRKFWRPYQMNIMSEVKYWPTSKM